MLDGPSPVANSVPKNNSYSTNDDDVTASFVISGNGGSDASNLPSPNNSEEPLPPELQPTPILIQVSLHTIYSVPMATKYVYGCMNTWTICIMYKTYRIVWYMYMHEKF